MQLINLKIIIELDKKYNKAEKNSNKMNEQICYCYDELFPTRKSQADSIIRYIDSYNDNDRFALLLNGSWGEGKTSLIKGIEDKCQNKYNMIFIQPMMFDKRDLLTKYFFERLKEILNEKKIYTGKGSNVELYFSSLLNWVNKKSTVGFIDNIINKETKDFREIKEELQSDIKKYVEDKKIIVIVDDFDRVEVETIKEVLMFIREIIDFDGISIILLMEYSKIISNSIDDAYLNKYIDFRINLNSVEINEIITTFVETAIRLEENNNDLKNKKTILIDGIIDVFIKLEKLCEEKIEKIEKIDKKEENEAKDIYIEIKKEIKSNKKNIRLIKKITREYIKAYHQLYIKARNQNIENEDLKIELDNDDIKCILKFIIVKNIFIDEYNEMVNQGSIYNYLNEIYPQNPKKSYIVSLFNEVSSYRESLKNINRYIMLDALMKNQVDDIKYETLTVKESKLKKLDGYDFPIDRDIWNLKEYNEGIEKFNDLNNLIWGDYCEKGDRIKTKIRIKKIEDLLLKHLQKYDEKKGIKLLEIYYNTNRIFDRSEFSYGFITKIYKIIKSESYTQNDISIIKNNVNIIRNENIKYLCRFIDAVFKIRDENKKFEVAVYNNLDRFNDKLAELLKVSDKYHTNKEMFYNLLEKVKSNINKIEEKSGMNKNYLYVSITKFKMIEKICSRIESKIPHMPEIDRSLREYIEYCRDSKEFENVALNTLENILTSEEFEEEHLDVCYGMLNGLMNFKKEVKYRQIINLMDRVIEKANKNRYPHQYTILQLQNLIIYKEVCKNSIYNSIES
ncbi:MAG: P-loop NTPase fold protein [Clostridium sp.]